jgi:uncharacterized membrane protein
LLLLRELGWGFADFAALAWFVLLWLGYVRLQRWVTHRYQGINAMMPGIRIAWMHAMAGRENRITDASLIGHVVHSTSFYGSATLIVIAALLGALGNVGGLHDQLASIAGYEVQTRAALTAKLLLLLVIAVYGLFCFIWALRQQNYFVALVGAMPSRPDTRGLSQRIDLHPDPTGRDDVLARSSGTVLSQAQASFNAGTRCYYFALAALCWLLGPLALAIAATLIVAILLYRQIYSPTAIAVREAANILHTPLS